MTTKRLTDENWAEVVATMVDLTKHSKIAWSASYEHDDIVYSCTILERTVTVSEPTGIPVVELVTENGARWRLPDTNHGHRLVAAIDEQLSRQARAFGQQILDEGVKLVSSAPPTNEQAREEERDSDR